MKHTMIAACVAALMITGCASTSDYAKYADSQRDIQMAKSAAEAERFKAMALIAANASDPTTKVAAMFALQGASGGNNQQQVVVAAPKDAWDSAREWLGLILPTAVQAYGINANKQVAIAQSNNSRAVAESTNATFATMGGHIAAGGTAVGTVATAGFASNQAIATAGLTAVQSTATSLGQNIENTAVAGITGTQNVAQSGLTAVQTTATAGLTAVQTTAANGITAVTGVANTAITNKPVICSTDGTTVACN